MSFECEVIVKLDFALITLSEFDFFLKFCLCIRIFFHAEAGIVLISFLNFEKNQ